MIKYARLYDTINVYFLQINFIWKVALGIDLSKLTQVATYKFLDTGTPS